jgi:hypothetical protein
MQRRDDKRTKEEKDASRAPSEARRKALMTETGLSQQHVKQLVSGAAAVAKGNALAVASQKPSMLAWDAPKAARAEAAEAFKVLTAPWGTLGAGAVVPGAVVPRHTPPLLTLRWSPEARSGNGRGAKRRGRRGRTTKALTGAQRASPATCASPATWSRTCLARPSTAGKKRSRGRCSGGALVRGRSRGRSRRSAASRRRKNQPGQQNAQQPQPPGGQGTAAAVHRRTALCGARFALKMKKWLSRLKTLFFRRSPPLPLPPPAPRHWNPCAQSPFRGSISSKKRDDS